MQHLENLAEDKSYPTKDRQKFKGWLLKWTQGRIPLLVSLFIEILAPAKMLSKCFQAEDIDIVGSVSHVESVKKQLTRIEQKPFNQLPTVKRLLDKIQEEDGKYTLQGVVLKDYVNGLLSTERKKDHLVNAVKDAIGKRLEDDQDEFSSMSSTFLNTQGWSVAEDAEFLDDVLEKLYEQYKKPLENAGFDGTVNDLLLQWHAIFEYTIKYLSPSSVDYRKIWHQLFVSSRSKEWNLILLLVELLFCLPVSNAKVERLFSLMNRVKTDSRASLGESRINSLLRIVMEGPTIDDFDPIPAIDLWATDAVRRPNQHPTGCYTPREKKNRPTTLMDIPEVDFSED